MSSWMTVNATGVLSAKCPKQWPEKLRHGKKLKLPKDATSHQAKNQACVWTNSNECSPQQAAGYQNPKPQTRKTLEQLQLEFLTMKLLIDLFTPLLLHILANGFFIPMTSYGTDQRAFRPKFSTPQLLLHRRHPLKNLSGGQTFDHPHHFRWTRAGHRLDQEMHMIFVCANLSKGDLIAFGDVQADVFAHLVDLRVHDDTSILGRTHDVVDQCRDIVPLMTIVAHNSDNTISEKAEASFKESNPQRYKRL